MFKQESQEKDTSGSWSPIGSSNKTEGTRGFADKLESAIQTNLTLDSIFSKINEIDEGARRLSRSFGLGRDAAQNLKGYLGDTIPLMLKLGFEATKAFEIMYESSYKVGRNLILSPDAVNSLALIEKVLGIDPANLVEGFTKGGMSLESMGKEMKSVQETLSNAGVPAQKVAGEVVKYMDKMTMFDFSNGVEGLAKMAAKASVMRVDLSETFKLSDKLLDPKAAMEFSNTLSRLGITTSELVDPLKAMQMAMYEPEKLQEEMANMVSQMYKLNEAGTAFKMDPMARITLAELAKDTGLNVENLEKMGLYQAKMTAQGPDFLKAFNVPKIKAPIDEKTETLIRNAAELNDKGEWTLNISGEQRVIRDIDDNLLQKFQKERLKEGGTLEELAVEQMNIQDQILNQIISMTAAPGYGIATSKTTGEGLDLMSDFAKSLDAASKKIDLFDVKKMSETFDDAVGDASDFISLMLKPSTDLQTAFTELKKETEGVINFFNTIKSQSIEGATAFTAEMKENPNAESLMNLMEPLLTKMVDKISSIGSNSSDVVTQTDDAIIDLGTQKVQPLPYETIGISPNAEDFEENILDAINRHLQKNNTSQNFVVNVPEMPKNDYKINELIDYLKTNENNYNNTPNQQDDPIRVYLESFGMSFREMTSFLQKIDQNKPISETDNNKIVYPEERIIQNQLRTELEKLGFNLKLNLPEIQTVKLDKDFVTLKYDDFLNNLKNILSGSKLSLETDKVKVEPTNISVDTNKVTDKIDKTITDQIRVLDNTLIEKLKNQPSIKFENADQIVSNFNESFEKIKNSKIGFDKLPDNLKLSVPEIKPLEVKEPTFGSAEKTMSDFETNFKNIMSDFSKSKIGFDDLPNDLKLITPEIKPLEVKEPTFESAEKTMSDFESNFKNIMSDFSKSKIGFDELPKDIKVDIPEIKPLEDIKVNIPELKPLEVKEPTFDVAQQIMSNFDNTFKSNITELNNSKIGFETLPDNLNLNVPEIKPLEVKEPNFDFTSRFTTELDEVFNRNIDKIGETQINIPEINPISVKEPTFESAENIMSNFRDLLTNNISEIKDSNLESKTQPITDKINEPLTNIVNPPIKQDNFLMESLTSIMNNITKNQEIKFSNTVPQLTPNTVQVKPEIPNQRQFEPLQNITQTVTTNNNSNINGNLSGEFKVTINTDGMSQNVDTEMLRRTLNSPDFQRQITEAVVKTATQGGATLSRPVTPYDKNTGYANILNTATS